jgi:hypothetical protein
MANKKVEFHQYTEEENKAIEKIAKMEDSVLRNTALRKFAQEAKLNYPTVYQKMLYVKEPPSERRKKQKKKAQRRKEIREGNPVPVKKKSKHRPYQRQNHVPHKPGTPLMVSQTEIRFNIVGMEFRKQKDGTTEFVIKL